MGRVAESHAPFWVKIGMRSWNAKRVPVGRCLARFAVAVKVWETALCEKDFCHCSGAFGVSEIDGCFVGVGLGLRLDIFGSRKRCSGGGGGYSDGGYDVRAFESKG